MTGTFQVAEMAPQGGYEQIFAVSPRDARLYRVSEKMAMIFGVITLLLLFLDVAIWAQGTLKVPFSRVLFLEAPFPAAFVLSAWIHRRIARKHGLL